MTPPSSNIAAQPVAGWEYNRRRLRPSPHTTMTSYPEKITFGEMRSSGVCDVLVFCRDHRCSHHVAINADRWPDNIKLSDVEPDFVCTACGKRGAEIRPKFSQAKMGTG